MNGPTESVSVLVVDDDPGFADRIATRLEREDARFTVETATSADEGLELLAVEALDCVLSGYELTGSNGIEFLEAVREGAPDLPFILFPDEGSEEIASEAISAGVTDYLRKDPAGTQHVVLAKRIDNAVAQYRTEQRLDATRERYRSLFENNPAVIWEVDLSSAKRTAESLADDVDELEPYLLERPEEVERLFEEIEVIDINQTGLDFYGATSKEEVLDRFGEIVTEESVETHAAAWARVAEGTREFRTENVVQTLDGERRHELFEMHVPAAYADEFSRAYITVIDITQRIEREQDLEWYRRLVRDLEDVATVIDPDGTITYVSPSVRRVLGYEQEELIGENGFGYQPPETSQAVAEAIEAVLATPDESRTVQTKVRRADGSWCWIESTVRNRLEDDLIGGLLVSSREITERKERELQLERYEAYLQESTDIITVLDDSGEIKYQSPAVERLTGYEPGELIGRNAFEFMHPDDRDASFETFTELLSKPGETVTTEGRFRTADDEWRWFEIRATNQLNHEAIKGIIINNRDVTERKQRERELRRTQRRYQSLIDNTHDAIVRIEFDGGKPIIREANPAFKSLFEPPDGDVIGTDLDHVVASADDRDEARKFSRRVRNGEHLSGEITRETVDGPRDFLWQAVPVQDPASGQFETGFGVYTDITEQKQREAELERQIERLDKFASVISHDLRNPLNLGMAKLELAAEECDSEHLDDVADSLTRMDTLIEETLTLAQAGQTLGETERVALPTLIDASWRNVESAAATLVTDTDARIEADRMRLQQLLENLLRNAIEHAGPDITVRVGDLPNGFYVEDDGPGIPEQAADDIFEAGHTIDDDGTGLGLSIVQEITDAHGWDIAVTQGQDGGARFEISGVDLADR